MLPDNTRDFRAIASFRTSCIHSFLTVFSFPENQFNDLPLKDGADALLVNWCEVTLSRPDEKVIYHNAFVTRYTVTDDNVAEIVQAGRTRWKVENENNNTNKTKGYHLEHNFIHGKQHLAALLATLNILSLLFHTLLERLDEKYINGCDRICRLARPFLMICGL